MQITIRSDFHAYCSFLIPVGFDMAKFYTFTMTKDNEIIPPHKDYKSSALSLNSLDAYLFEIEVKQHCSKNELILSLVVERNARRKTYSKTQRLQF